MPTIKNPSLVIPGSWNPAILQPAWIAQTVFGEPNIPVTMEFTTIPANAPKFTMQNVTFIPDPKKLTIIANSMELEELRKLETSGIIILEALSHTPTKSFGENFEIIEEVTDQDLLRIFEIEEDLSEVIGCDFSPGPTKVVRTIQLENRILNFTRTLIGTQVIFGFNFHYDTQGPENSVQLINASFERNLEIVNNVMQYYNLSTDNHMEASSVQ